MSSLLGNDQLEQRGQTGVDQANQNGEDEHEHDHDGGLTDQILLGRPGDLLQLVPHVLKEAADALEEIANALDEGRLVLLLPPFR